MATTSGGSGRLSSQNLRDFLRIKEEDHHHILINRAAANAGVEQNSISGLTLSAILGEKVRPPHEEPPRLPVQSNRTLLDIIQDDQDPHGEDGGQSWRRLTERLRLSYSSANGSGWTSTAHNDGVNGNDAGNRMISNSTERNISASRRSTEAIGRFEPTSSLLPTRRWQREADNIDENSNGGGAAVELEQQQYSGRVSLMTLLAETDGSIYMVEQEEKDNNLEEVSGGGGDGNCCVCMAKRKGAAFIPCGHTFCRLCSRQLLVERRNCPLCNAPIHEILDIF